MAEGDTPQDEAPELELDDETRRFIAEPAEPAMVAEIDQDRQAAVDAVRGADCVSVAWLRETGADDDGSTFGSTHWLISPIELAPSLILFVMAKAWMDFQNLTGADDGEIARALRAALEEGIGQ